MDLGIVGKRALVLASSKGLGRACAMSLAREGASVTITARTREALEVTAEDIRKLTGANVSTVVADIATEEGRKATLSACPNPDILVNNAGGPPTGSFRDWERGDWIAAIDANMLSAIFMIKATVDGMIERNFGRIVNITSSAVKAPIEALGLSNGARCGLTGFCAGLARQTVIHNVTINAILPGPFDTNRLAETLEVAAKVSGKSIEDITAERQAGNPSGRFGNPEEFGEFCAFICSAQAGYITGQNLLIDGGGYPGTF
jgi:3-oxoacyl-[acyl-carrier protein] reductase